MPYTTIIWGEEQAANGLTGTAAKSVGGDGFTASADKVVFPSSNDWIILGFGMTGDTKPQGSALLPDASNGNKPFYGPGSQVFYPHGWLNLQKLGFGYRIMAGDSVTGQTSSTNVNEGSVLGAHVASSLLPYPRRFPGGTHFAELVTVTSAAAVTANSGAATVFAASTNTSNWYDAGATYYLIGVSGHLCGATFGGICHVTNVGGRWKGYNPGIPINALSAVDFSSNQPFTPFPEPIGPIKGIDLNTNVKLGMCASSAGAVNFVLHMIRQ